MSLLPVLIAISLLSFGMLKFIPGDPARIMAGLEASTEDVERMRVEMGLDRPLWEQYTSFISRAVQGDFGESIRTRRSVSVEIRARFGNTMMLATVSMLMAAVLGISVGILAATRHQSIWDNLAMATVTLGISMPVYWLGLMLMLLFSVKLHLFPTSGNDSPLSIVLPAITLGLNSAAVIARLARSSMLEVLHQDYIRTARAKGISERRVIWGHALRNALIPVITIMGMQFGYLLGGAAITETIFAWPGLGRLMVESIGNRDYPVIQGSILFLAIVFSLINLLVDISYAMVDRRVRYE